MPTRPPNSPLASCIGGSLLRRRSSMASKSAVKLTAMRLPVGPRQIIDALVAGGVGPGHGFEAGNFL